MELTSQEKKAKQQKRVRILLVGFFIVIQIFVVTLLMASKLYETLFYSELFFAGLAGLILLDVYINKRRRKVNNILSKLGLMPKPTEASMFVMALTALVLLLTNGEVWSEMFYVLLNDEKGKSVLIFVYIVIGIFLSIYHVFSKRKKTTWEMQTLKWFTVITLATVAISTAIFVYQSKQPAYLVFTVWNAIQAFILIFLLGKQRVGQYIKLPTRNASYLEVILGVLVVSIVLYVESRFQTHWSIAFSSVLIVWSMVGNYFQYDEEKVVTQDISLL